MNWIPLIAARPNRASVPFVFNVPAHRISIEVRYQLLSNFNPYGGMITCPLPPAHVSINMGLFKMISQRGAEQNVIDVSGVSTRETNLGG